jgi:cis-3-alkyl-4-acyloxetan-2-one decarboxylase
VLMNTAAFRMPKCPWAIHLCHIPWFGPVAVQGLNLFVRAALRTTVCKHERMTPAVKAGYAAPYDSWRHREAVLRFVLDIPLKTSHPSYQTLANIETGLGQFAGHPICLIWGMRDWVFTEKFLDRFLDFFPQAEVHRLTDAGHYVMEDAHEQIIPLIEGFLQKHPSAKL